MSWDNMTHFDAIQIIALEITHRMIDPDAAEDMWEDWPEIGESDWIAICDEIEARYLQSSISIERMEHAYKILAARADKETPI